MRMKYSVIASALVVALFTSTVTTYAEGPVAATVAAPQEPLVAHSLDLNTHAVNLIPQPGAPVRSMPKRSSMRRSRNRMLPCSALRVYKGARLGRLTATVEWVAR